MALTFRLSVGGPHFASGLEGDYGNARDAAVDGNRTTERGPGGSGPPRIRLATSCDGWPGYPRRPRSSCRFPCGAASSGWRACRIGAQVTGLKQCGFQTKQVSIGDGSFVNVGCWFEGAGRIDIGRNVFLGPQVMIITSIHQIDEDGQVARMPVSRAGAHRRPMLARGACHHHAGRDHRRGNHCRRGRSGDQGLQAGRSLCRRSCAPGSLIIARRSEPIAHPGRLVRCWRQFAGGLACRRCVPVCHSARTVPCPCATGTLDRCLCATGLQRECPGGPRGPLPVPPGKPPASLLSAQTRIRHAPPPADLAVGRCPARSRVPRLRVPRLRVPRYVSPDYVSPDYVSPNYVPPDYVPPDYVPPD